MKKPYIHFSFTIIPEKSLIKVQATNEGFDKKNLINALNDITAKIKSTDLIHDGVGEYIEEYFPIVEINAEDLKLKQIVYHEDLYWGRESMKIVGIRETEVELEGDYSGGTHNVCQKSWMPIKGLYLTQQKKI